MQTDGYLFTLQGGVITLPLIFGLALRDADDFIWKIRIRIQIDHIFYASQQLLLHRSPHQGQGSLVDIQHLDFTGKLIEHFGVLSEVCAQVSHPLLFQLIDVLLER